MSVPFVAYSQEPDIGCLFSDQAGVSAASCDGLGTQQCQQWREKLFRRHPSFASAMAFNYKREAKNHGYVSANTQLRGIEEQLKLGGTGLFCDCNDDEIRQYAEVKSRRLEVDFMAIGNGSTSSAAFKWLESEMEQAGFALPLEIKATDSEETIKKKKIAACIRVFTEKWWRRQLRVAAVRGVEVVCRRLGLVSRKNGVYVSDYTYTRRQFQLQRNGEMLEQMEAENEEGYKATLAEMAEASISNPSHRHDELMTRMRGFEEIANETGFVGLFFTLTCPSAYHAVLDNGGRNAKFNGADPREAQEYLCQVWAQIRAKWDREGIRCFGFRVAEPHQDATPHWHLMLFFTPDITDRASCIFEAYALKEDGHEKGADKYRSKVVEIDPEKGSATGYVAKYISKNISGLDREGEDFEAGEAVAVTAGRVDAWASCWGIRQFQQIGSVSVTVWREMRRLREPVEDVSLEEMEKIRAACDAGDWGAFVELMGGPLVNKNAMPIRALHVVSKEENDYGEMVAKIKGIILKDICSYVTRIHEWKITRIDIEDEESGLDFSAGRFSSGP